MDLTDLLEPERIHCRVALQSKKRALQTVAELLATASGNEDLPERKVLDALIARERLGSTGLGHGVALPHSRLAGVDRPIAAMLTLESGVDFDAADEVAVDIVCGLLVPAECNEEHLQILAALARRFNDKALRERIRQCTTGDAMLADLKQSASAA